MTILCNTMSSAFDLIIFQIFNRLNFHFTMIPAGAVDVERYEEKRRFENKTAVWLLTAMQHSAVN